MDEQVSTVIDAETLSIIDRVVNYRRPKRVILFGSRGRGTARPDSDVDLCILYESLEKRNVEIMEELYLDLFGHMPHPVDLVVYDEASFANRAKLPHSFESVIDIEGLTVYGTA
jgi:uncharacterized protein